MKFKKIVRQINSVTSGINNITNGVNTVTKGVVQAPKKAAQQTLNGLLIPVKAILKLVTSIIVILRKSMQQIFLYAKCFIKFLKNFYKCAFFYLLDIIKYLIMIVWLSLTVGFVAFAKNDKYTAKQYAKDVAYYFSKITYSTKIMNDCYRCKKKKDPVTKSFMQELKELVAKELNPDVKSRKQPLSFFTILLWSSISIIGLLFLNYVYQLKKLWSHIKDWFNNWLDGKSNDLSNDQKSRGFRIWIAIIIILFLVLAINQKWAGNSRYALLVILVILIFGPIFGGIGYYLIEYLTNTDSTNLTNTDSITIPELDVVGVLKESQSDTKTLPQYMTPINSSGVNNSNIDSNSNSNSESERRENYLNETAGREYWENRREQNKKQKITPH